MHQRGQGTVNESSKLAAGSRTHRERISSPQFLQDRSLEARSQRSPGASSPPALPGTVPSPLLP